MRAGSPEDLLAAGRKGRVMCLAETSAGDPARATPQAAALDALLANFSIEATARQVETAGELMGRLAPGTEVYVPFLPGSTFTDNLPACRMLKEMGLRPVPHLAARAVSGPAELDGGLALFAEAGVDTMLLIAGDLPRQAGVFANTLDVLETGLLAHHGIRRLGVAGHPEGHPAADQGELERALHIKTDYARETGTEIWAVTQFIFDAGAFTAWDSRLQEAGVDLPVRAGLPGPAKIRTLLSYAMQCGVGASARMLSRRPSAAKLLGRWTPDDTVHDLAAWRLASPQSRLQGLHFFPFGGLGAALEWISEARLRAASGDMG